MSSLTTTFDPETKIWSGATQEPLGHLDIPLGEMILSSLSRQPTKIVQISDNSGVQLTNKDIKERSIKISNWLPTINCKKDDVIGIVARNSENMAPLVVAALLTGSPINTLDTEFSTKEFVHMFSFTKPKFVFCDEDKYDEVKKSLEALKLDSCIFTVEDNRIGVMSIAEVLRTVIVEDIDNFSFPKIGDGRKRIAFITCSSGTTGLPKGVCVSHAALLQIADGMGKSRMDNLLCFSSLYWLSGVLCLIGGLISEICRIITNEPFTPENMLRMIEQYKVSMIYTPPSQFAMCTQSPDIEKRNLSSVRLYLCSGSAVPAPLIEKMNSYMKNGFVNVIYGMTEIGGISGMMATASNIDSVGKVANNTKVKIIDDYGNKLGVGEQGEIVVEPMFNFMGYYGRPEETAGIMDQDGWTRTGDIGYFDEDGFLYLVDRKKDILKYKNYQFSPSEIETEILKVPGIFQALACGIPDLVATDLPAALIIKAADSNVTKAQVYDHFAANVSDPKQLRGGVYFVDSFPMTPSGKYIRRLGKEIAIKLYNERS